MGYWSTDILGGDTPLDIEYSIYGICGIEKYDYSKATAKKNTIDSVVLLKNLPSIEKMINNDAGYEDMGYQVLAVVMMEIGAKMPKKLKTRIIEACDNDDWAKTDTSRRTVVTNLKHAVTVYNTDPISIKSKGLFETINAGFNKE